MDKYVDCDERTRIIFESNKKNGGIVTFFFYRLKNKINWILIMINVEIAVDGFLTVKMPKNP